ncbi:Pyruvate/Phosphoenolpyruvate kinase-like domain-containing protein, partial [Mycena polygramma]
PSGETIFSVANKHVAIIPQIESQVGIDNLEAILALDEVSAFMIGIGDLRLDMGLPLAVTGDEPQFVKAVGKATKLSKECNIPLLGAAINKEALKACLDEGYTFLLRSVDLHELAYGVMRTLGETREQAEGHRYMRKVESKL